MQSASEPNAFRPARDHSPLRSNNSVCRLSEEKVVKPPQRPTVTKMRQLGVTGSRPPEVVSMKKKPMTKDPVTFTKSVPRGERLAQPPRQAERAKVAGDAAQRAADPDHENIVHRVNSVVALKSGGRPRKESSASWAGMTTGGCPIGRGIRQNLLRARVKHRAKVLAAREEGSRREMVQVGANACKYGWSSWAQFSESKELPAVHEAKTSSPLSRPMSTPKPDEINDALPGRPQPVARPGEFVFAAAHLDHGHIYGQSNGLVEAGGELRWVYDPDPAKVAAFQKQYPQAKASRAVSRRFSTTAEVRLVAAAAIPASAGPSAAA